MTKKILTHIQFSHINKYYTKKHLGFFTDKNKSKTILDDAEIELKGGECILLTGKNGSGKSTLLRILAGILKPNSATVTTGFESFSWKKAKRLIRRQVMYLYQEPYMFDGSVTRNLRYALNNKQLNSKANTQIAHALKYANLEHRAETSAKCLSGGERQRVALAQAWLKQPNILLLDEPTANMDEESRLATEALLDQFKHNGTALLIASHDIDHFNQTMDKRLLLEKGKICEITDQLTSAHDNVSLFPSTSSKRKA